MTTSGSAHLRALGATLPLLDTERLHSWGRTLAARLPARARLLVAVIDGSAAEAQHLTSELVGRGTAERAPLSAIALYTDSSATTALANDYASQEAFARQVRARGRPGDVLLLSPSGGSPHAAHAGRNLGLTVWALTGPGPNPLAARRLGDILVVSCNSDEFVRRLKGGDRLVVDERERAALLQALDRVEGVLVFSQDTPEQVLAELRPHMWVKRGDHAGRRIPEADLVESWGGQVVVVPYGDGYSTTSLVARLTHQSDAR